MTYKKNRLKLDWSLDTADDRSAFVNKYIENFTGAPLTEDELETIANYLLWGKDKTGKSFSKSGLVEIETKNSTWTKKNIDSLDEIMESPTFNEASISFSLATPKIPREVFSRARALSECPASMRPTFEALFHQIDELDLSINLYEILHGKREKPPRDELLRAFTEADIEALREKISHWNQFFYLKQRHYLVELRREQFTLKDTYSQPILRQTPPEPFSPEETPEFGADISILPLGLFEQNSIASLLFQDRNKLCPQTFSEEDLKKISDWLWREKDTTIHKFDFRDLESVYQLFQQLGELEDGVDLNESTNSLIKTLRYYIELAELSEVHKQILDLKIKKYKNQDIADVINKDFGKTYTANYISTIFRQKIIPKINEAAAFHFRVIENLFFEEEFKTCSCCGRVLLRDPEFFVRKTRAKDGLSNRCKRCDKEDRDSKKEVKS